MRSHECGVQFHSRCVGRIRCLVLVSKENVRSFIVCRVRAFHLGKRESISAPQRLRCSHKGY